VLVTGLHSLVAKLSVALTGVRNKQVQSVTLIVCTSMTSRCGSQAGYSLSFMGISFWLISVGYPDDIIPCVLVREC
jgi:hypothetical protein